MTDWVNFVWVVEIGQYFMTKDTAEFSQFTDAVACREHTLPRDEDASEPKGWIRGNSKIGPVLEVATCCLQGEYGFEIRIVSMNQDNSHSWIRISHGLNRLVTKLKNNEQENSEMQFEEYALRLNASDFASCSKAKAKPQRRDSASSIARTVPIRERIWTDVWTRRIFNFWLWSVGETDQSSSSWKSTSRRRWSDWILENKWFFENTQNDCHHWSDDKWKNSMAGGGGGNKKRFQYCTDSSGEILCLRALQGHSGRSLVDPTLQDNVVIPNGFFQYICHFVCAINLHSIINPGLIPGGQNFEQTTDSILSSCGSYGQKP